MSEGYNSIVHLLPDIIYKLDPDGRFTYINNSVRNLGYEPEDLIEKHFSVLIHPDDIGSVQRNIALKKLLAKELSADEPMKLFDERRTGKRITKNLYVRLVPKDRAVIDNDKENFPCYEVIAVGTYANMGENVRQDFNGTLGVIRNVTDLRKSTDALYRCIQHYQTLVENTDDIISILAPDGTILFTSPSVKRVLGYDPEFFIGDNIFDYIHSEDVKKIVVHYSKTVPQSPEFSFDCRVRNNSDLWKIFKTGGRVIFDIHGRSLCILMISHDITKQREVEEELRSAYDQMEKRVADRTMALANANERLKVEIDTRKKHETMLLESEKNYRNLVNSIDDIVLDLDPEGIILFVNTAIKKITGFRPDEVVGNNIMQFIHQDDIDEFITSFWQAKNGENIDTKDVIKGICEDYELRIVRKDGENIWVEMRCRPVMDSQGKIISYRGIANDITKRKESEDEVLRTSKIESLGLFAGGIAHDFNNLLTAILGNISLVKQNIIKDEDNYRILSDAESASQMAKNLTNQLLTFSKGGAPIIKSTSIQSLLIDTAYFVLSGSSIKCDFFLPARLWDADIDRGQVSQVVHNIVLNARQAMPEGGIITISAENVTLDESIDAPLPCGRYIRVVVKDQGQGMPKRVLKNIFDPYFTTKEKGSGLGLSVSYSIIKKHKGHITVESTRGKGSSFIIYLPASEEKAIPDRHPVYKKPLKGGRIIIVDDDLAILKVGERFLQYLGFDAACVTNSNDALLSYKQARKAKKPYDIVILDLIIPGDQSALYTLSKLQDIDPTVKAIVTSGYANDPVMVDYEKYGFSGSLAKPFNIDELKEELYRVMNL